MVALADKVISVWDGSSGGIANCVRYAKRRCKAVIIIDPAVIGRGIQCEICD